MNMTQIKKDQQPKTSDSLQKLFQIRYIKTYKVNEFTIRIIMYLIKFSVFYIEK